MKFQFLVVAYFFDDPTHPTYPNSPRVINSYRNFVIEHLVNNSRESELRNLIKTLENDEQIKSMQSLFDFVDEMHGLEHQYQKLMEDVSFAPFYESYLNRIEEFSKKEKSLENKKALNYLYAAGLSKLYAIRKNMERNQNKEKCGTRESSNETINSMEVTIASIVEQSIHFKMESHRANALINDAFKIKMHLITGEIDVQIETMAKSFASIQNDLRKKLNQKKLLRNALNRRASLILVEHIAEMVSICSRITTLSSRYDILSDFQIPRNGSSSKNKIKDDVHEKLEIKQDLEKIIESIDLSMESKINQYFSDDEVEKKEIHEQLEVMQDYYIKPWNELRNSTQGIMATLLIDVNGLLDQFYSTQNPNSTATSLSVQKIRESLKDLREVLGDIRRTEDDTFEIQEIIDELSKDICILVDIYSRVDSYMALEKLKTYISYIYSRDLKRIDITNAELKNEITKLDRLIFKDIVAAIQ